MKKTRFNNRKLRINRFYFVSMNNIVHFWKKKSILPKLKTKYALKQLYKCVYKIAVAGPGVGCKVKDALLTESFEFHYKLYATGSPS